MLKFFGKVDYIGVFVVIGGLEEDVLVDVFEVQYDDYNKIMVKVFVDCLVEVFVEYFYECVCKVYWGYVLNENFSNEELICENY